MCLKPVSKIYNEYINKKMNALNQFIYNKLIN